MKEIKLTLTIEEVNKVLDALGGQPFKQVFNLIQKIQEQAAPQVLQLEDQQGTVKPETKKGDE